MSGQLALVTSEEVVAAAVWETLPLEVQRAVALALAQDAGAADRGGAR